MVEEFKKQLLNYVVGKLPNEKGKDEEIFSSINEVSENDWRDFIPTAWNNFRFEGLIEVLNSDKIIVYGGYKVLLTDEVRGIIVILNNDFKPIKTFYQYESGTYLRYIQCMLQNDDGEFVAIDCTDFPQDENWTFTASQKRFVMFNNFASKINEDYNLTLQKSYIFPNDYFNFYCKQIYKNPSSSQYVFVGTYLRNQSSPDFDGIRVFELKINVGSSNEWKKWDDDGQGYFFGTSYVEFKDEKFFARLLLSKNNINDRDVAIWEKNFEQTEFKWIVFYTLVFNPNIDTFNYVNQATFLNKDDLYFVLNNQMWGRKGNLEKKYIGLYHTNLQTKTTVVIYEKYLGEYDYTNQKAIYIFQNNNNLYVEFNDNIDVENNKADYYIQRLNNDVWNPLILAQNANYIYNQRALYVKNDYNLLNIYLYPINLRRPTWQLYNVKENYNQSNYNGYSYIDENVLNSNDIELYSDNLLVFARNLYNKTMNGSTTISSFEIPSGYLNDRIIEVKNLLSKTKFKMIGDIKTFEKNIYETIYLNFIYSFVVADKNNSKITTTNPKASTFLNQSINNKNYRNCHFYSKVILTFDDNSIREVGYSIKRLNETKVKIIFAINVKKRINQAEFVSNDKTIVYHTIDLTSLEINKTYVIKQDLEVL